ncbi:putative TIM-barrel fold metal-dependent hydrolase [Saccharomonospora marina XMU15]|uniref:Putative TIM-barrel fold metal-dependent hydrolase n=1 Tax=Saccharomonospora marina XMU15 TaxID=882083 RepID=H5WXE5_9PSEU|nr:amidohydrolase family protein [Saccharomonospora marina]EHR49474.1 putative TIM-barrel fold metal-dependent hydrolase [Saccharomonospora marina XMU15]
MIDGYEVVDAHVHVPALATVKPSWLEWADRFCGPHPWRSVYDEAGNPVPRRLDELFEQEGVDRALLFCEYSPRATGIQPIEDNLPFVEYNPARFRLVANVNPHLHYPVVAEVRRQLGLGAVALKLHPVHAGFSPADKELYPTYQLCAERGTPVILHSGTSSFPGARARYGNPELLVDVVEDFPELPFVFAHGGRGWWYDVAAFLALSKDNVWLDLAGLPPRKLPEYYARFDLSRLARKFVFGTDWPGVPGAARNVRALVELGLERDVLADVLAGNADKLY